jgi:hypothetical protein
MLRRKEECKKEKIVLIGVCGLNGNFRFLFDNPIIKSTHEQTTHNHTFLKAKQKQTQIQTNKQTNRQTNKQTIILFKSETLKVKTLFPSF